MHNRESQNYVKSDITAKLESVGCQAHVIEYIPRYTKEYKSIKDIPSKCLIEVLTDETKIFKEWSRSLQQAQKSDSPSVVLAFGLSGLIFSRVGGRIILRQAIVY